MTFKLTICFVTSVLALQAQKFSKTSFLDVESEMKYSSDYYGFNPSNQLGTMNVSAILSTWADWDEFNNLSKIRFWKVVS